MGVLILLGIGGLGSIFAQTDTEREAERTLRELQINVTDEPNVSVPEVYKTPPKIFEQVVGGTPEWKLSYFCKYHKSDDLKNIIHEQFATKLFDAKGKETKMVDYTVSSNPATNQLIVRCPAQEDAQAVLEVLEQVDVKPIQVKIDCLISEVYADMTFDRETTLAIENLFGESVTMKPGGTAFGADVQQLVQDDAYLPAFPGASMREVARSRMGLNIGFLSAGKAGHTFTALIDLLESRGYLKILMNPTLEVVNGGTAKVSSMQKVPLDRTTMRSTVSDYLETSTLYEEVIDSLEVTAHVFGDGYIGLETTAILGSKNTPEGVKQVPIITRKEITNKENRIRQGESLIIGGIRKNEEFAVVRGVPILKDIPIIGYLFSSEDTEQRAVETIFILTPTISTDGAPKDEVMKTIQRKHEPDSPTGLGEMITDPFGLKAREVAHEQVLDEAEQLRLEAEVEKAQARIDVREANERTEKAEEELNNMKAEAEKAKAAEEAKAAAEKALADARKAQADADKGTEGAEKTENEGSDTSGAGAEKSASKDNTPKTQNTKEPEKTKA
ncbi:MAG: hypothetical protein ABIF19_18195 [Planctomycetota bacterium]